MFGKTISDADGARIEVIGSLSVQFEKIIQRIVAQFVFILYLCA